MKTSLILFMVIFISGCASQKNHNLRESLNTEIKAGGSKVFNFSVVMINNKNKHQKNGMRQEERDDSRSGQRKPQSRSSAQDRNSSSAELTEYFDNRLKNLPIITLFCRKGYFVLDRLNANDEITIRAECHDTATTDDYVRFKSSALPAKIAEEKSL